MSREAYLENQLAELLSEGTRREFLKTRTVWPQLSNHLLSRPLVLRVELLTSPRTVLA